jgi:uroporphyrinogen-III synthase
VTRTLEGRVVVLTRAADRSESLGRLLEARGAVTLSAPSIEIRPAPRRSLDVAAARAVAGEFEWTVVTSREGVALADRLTAVAGGWPEVRGRVAAVGEGTASALRDAGRDPDLVPPTFTTAALGRAMPRGHGTVLLARADIAPAELEDVVASKGWTVERVVAYRTRLARRLPAEVAARLREGSVDAVTFTSASTVDGFVRAAGPDLVGRLSRTAGVHVVCIGPVTAEAARRAGFAVDGVARPHTIEGLAAAVDRVLGTATRTKERA